MKSALTLLLCACGVAAFGALEKSATSPDGRNEIRLYNEPLSYEVLRDGRAVVARSAIGLVGADGCAVELAARDDGVAYRFVASAAGEITVTNELSEVRFAEGCSFVLHKTAEIGCEESAASFCRDFASVNLATNEVAYLPLLAEGRGFACAVTDADVRDYPIWNLKGPSKGLQRAFQGAFAREPAKTLSVNWVPDAESDGRRLRKYKVLAEEPYLVKTRGPRTFPWRVFALGDTPADLVGSTIVEDLAGERAAGDFGWVRPGKVAWDWWNAFDNRGDPAGCTTATYERFIDFASSNGVEYVILDEGWSERLDIWKFHPNVDVPHLVDYAAKRNVGIVLWMAWAQVLDDEERVAAHFAKLGAKGFKVDFMDSGDARQERFLWKFAEACAKNGMLVDYHGCHRPTGLSKVWPNVLNWEGVHGLEQMKAYRGEDILANDVAVAFTRMLAGPMDYTPGAMDNYAAGAYPVAPEECVGNAVLDLPTWRNPGSLGTRARQMAMMALYPAPLQMLCDAPAKYERERECFDFMAKIPTTWTKAVGLGGTPQSYVAVARRAADGSWYVAGITGREGREVRLDTAFLGGGRWKAEVFCDAEDADRHPAHYAHTALALDAGEPLAVRFAPGGGYVARLSRAAEWGQAPNGEFWNGHSQRFIYAPAFGFKAVDGAVKYVYEVTDDRHRVRTFEAATPTASLETLWKDLPVGYVTAVCRGVAADGTPKGEAGRRTFWKKSAFDGRYPPAAKTFAMAEARVYDAYFDMPQTRYLMAHGRPDPSYYLSGYPSKMLSAQIEALVLRSKGLDGDFLAKRETLLATARRAADYLIAQAVPAGAPLGHFTRTYADGGEYGRFAGQEDRIMLVYPAQCGLAFAHLYEASGEAKYLEAAERIASTYMKLQGEDGTWFLLQNALTGEALAPNRLLPTLALEFFEALYRLTGKAAYRRTADRAFAYIENGPLKDWNWEGQFEDTGPAAERWANLTKHPACETAVYLLRRFPGDAAHLAQAEELVRFSEDQFVEWTAPYGDRAEPDGPDDGTWKYFCRPYSRWMTPCALEQYNCYHPIDSSAARMIDAYLALWRATRRPEYLAKARALGATATRMQESDGWINTWWIRGVERNDDRYHTWVNCMLATAQALGNLSRAERDEREREDAE